MIVLFDMDGIVLEGPRTDPSVYANAADAALAELGADPTETQRTELRHGGPETVVDRCEELEIDPDRFWELKETYASRGTHDRIRSGERGLYDDVDVIGDLSRRTTTGLVSNNRHETVEFVADHLGFEFDVARGRDPTLEGYRRRKPDTYYLDETLSKLDASEGLYVGDKPKDVVAGTAAGLETAFVRRPHNRDLDRPADATYELESLTELLEIVA
ncbi:haloacid dehalogenase superfamily, subfamily IA, variant 1 with third motif having Dx(3-4)D or Dx(3-4)E [Natronobacterium texcoconense]|uniref:Haloacid dehalogenase superfamily, subfamily IA, variant 1 with third motif having Dx(3-4)D or Dx(3-4)E n=2 Tax=Natronobacterium texcoconense TaxID=1095778 RepID=A0A1H0ZZ00_NATTX|nr:haloacid dehalogenase superfamily, subfamily IA, variant 1 with third motif having Dx(3-4)D or Dx(3-4)E [Natronobacterium texcoconense]